jgi:hypothetical protein
MWCFTIIIIIVVAAVGSVSVDATLKLIRHKCVLFLGFRVRWGRRGRQQLMASDIQHGKTL